MSGARLVSTGHFQPARVVPNAELERLVETDDEWIRRRVGIEERRWAGPDESVADMAVAAGRDCLTRGGIDPASIDLVVVATCTALDRTPNTAARVAAALGVGDQPAVIDVNTACSGFCHALAIAQHAIAASSSERALVIASEKLTDMTDFTDRSTCVLTADGAGAVVVERSESAQISPVVWGSVPELGPAIRIEHANDSKFAQEGSAVYRWTTRALPEIARAILERADLDPADLGVIVLHQANLRIIEPLAEKIGAPQAIVATDIRVSGNTSAASVPLALSKLLAERAEAGAPIASGTPILLFGFGGGLTYAGQVVQAP